MRTLRSLSNRQLDKLHARFMGYEWRHEMNSCRRRMIVRIGQERMNRLKKILP